MAKWCIDYGHGGEDSGAVNEKRYEKDDIVKLGDKVRKLLIANGEQVILTRDTDKTLSLEQRCIIANSNKADNFVSIHRNSFHKKEANGLETFSNIGSIKGRDLGRIVQSSILEKVPFTDRGYKEANFYVLRNTIMCAILIEVGFISNSKDNDLFDKNLDVIAEQIVRGCLKSINKTFIKPTPTPKVSYRVVCGSFKDKTNANKRVEEIKKLSGLNCFLVADTVKGVSMFRVICGSFTDKDNATLRMKEVKAKTKFDCFLLTTKI